MHTATQKVDTALTTQLLKGGLNSSGLLSRKSMAEDIHILFNFGLFKTIINCG